MPASAPVARVVDVSTTTNAAPATTVEPSELVSRRWMTAFALALVGVAAGWYGPIQILLPAQAERFALTGGGGKEALLALVTSVGAAASMVANPLWGAISDRTRSRWGRRIPILVAGTLIGGAGLVMLALAPGLPWMVAGWAAAQIGLNGPYAALAAVIADRVPERQRGLVGALFGIAQVVGVVVGTAVAVAAGQGSLGYLAIAIAVPALVTSFALVHRDPTLASDTSTTATARPAGAGTESETRTGDDVGSRTGTEARAFLRGMRPTALFVWVWTIRFLLYFVNALVVLYLFYYLSDAVGIEDPGTWVLVITVLNVVITAITAGVAGPLSDRWERRRVFVVAAGLVLAVGAVLMAMLPTLPVVLVAASVTGIGWGLYMAVEMAVLTRVLPAAESSGTMLGVGNIAAALPQVVAPAAASLLVTVLGGYPALYGVAAAISLVALACVPRLRGIR